MNDHLMERDFYKLELSEVYDLLQTDYNFSLLNLFNASSKE